MPEGHRGVLVSAQPEAPAPALPADLLASAAGPATPAQQASALATTWALRWLAELALAWPPGLRLPLAGAGRHAAAGNGQAGDSGSTSGSASLKEQQEAAGLWAGVWGGLVQQLAATAAQGLPAWLEEAALAVCCAVAHARLLPGAQLRAAALALPQVQRAALCPAALALLQAVHEVQPCSSGHDIAATVGLLPACMDAVAPAAASHLHAADGCLAAAVGLPPPGLGTSAAAPAAGQAVRSMLGLQGPGQYALAWQGAGQGDGSSTGPAWPHRCWWFPDSEALQHQQEVAQALCGEELAARLLAEEQRRGWRRQVALAALATRDAAEAAAAARKLQVAATPVVMQQLQQLQQQVQQAAAAAAEGGLMAALQPEPVMLSRLLGCAALAVELAAQLAAAAAAAVAPGQQPSQQQQECGTAAAELLAAAAAAVHAARQQAVALAGSAAFAAAVQQPVQQLCAALRPLLLLPSEEADACGAALLQLARSAEDALAADISAAAQALVAGAAGCASTPGFRVSWAAWAPAWAIMTCCCGCQPCWPGCGEARCVHSLHTPVDRLAVTAVLPPLTLLHHHCPAALQRPPPAGLHHTG